jgi:hypothetical protein
MEFVVMSVVACMALLLVEMYDDIAGDWIDRGATLSAGVDNLAGVSVTAAGGTAPGTPAAVRHSGSEEFDKAA